MKTDTQLLEWNVTAEMAESYRTASPFPHGIYDGLFNMDALRDAAVSYPARDGMGPGTEPFWHEYNNQREGKLEVRYKLYLPPEVQRIIDVVNGDVFVQKLRELTGIDDLSADPQMMGGAMHMIPPGGRLHVHSDFNRAGPAFRRLNVLLFLNEGWDPAWHGDLQLWDANGPVVSIMPELNRLAVFSTSHVSWHGHPENLACPPDKARKSIATYYYSMQPPPGYAHDQGTVWHPRFQ